MAGNENLKGIVLMVGAMAGFAIADAFVKLLSQVWSLGQVVFVLGLGGVVLFVPIALARGDALFSRDALHPVILLRNACEIIGGVGFMAALALTPISQASAILQATPLAVTLGAFLFLGEKVGWRRWVAVLLGFLGVLIVLRPGTEGFDPYALFAVLGVIGLSGRDLSTRRSPSQISNYVLASYGMAALTVAGLLMMMLQAPTVAPTIGTSWQTLAMVLFGSLGYFMVTVAMRKGDVGAVAPFRYTRIVFAVIIGWLIFSEVPDIWMITGSALIVGSGLYAFLRERKLAQTLPSSAEPG